MDSTHLSQILEKSVRDHSHLCPRQILGARLGLAGMKVLGFDEPPAKKRLMVIIETDGCFADGLSAATACTIGHRTLRVEDYGKTAAAFVDTLTGQAVRIAPALDIREKAYVYAPDETRHYFAQLRAYQTMLDSEMFSVRPVTLNTPIEAIISRPGVRINCDVCGEEIMNEREIKYNHLNLCHACSSTGYYRTEPKVMMPTVNVTQSEYQTAQAAFSVYTTK